MNTTYVCYIFGDTAGRLAANFNISLWMWIHMGTRLRADDDYFKCLARKNKVFETSTGSGYIYIFDIEI